jgi:hypothetical protein
MAYEHVPLMYQQPYHSTGVPLPVVGAPQGSPHCWGIQYNSEDRTCRNCDYQGTCRTEVIRKDLAARPVGAAPVPPPSYTTPPAPVRTIPVNYAAPPPTPYQYYTQPQPPQTPGAVRYAPQATQQQAPRPLQAPPPQYGYGSTYDPMFYALAQVPEPFRPQVLGETFVQRVAKNMVLAGFEALLKEMVLGVRQLQWWPKPATAAQQTVEVPR